MNDEKDLSAQHSSSEEDPRLSGQNENSGRSRGSQKTSPERPQASGGLMDEGLRPHERIRKKKDFLFLYQKGNRIRGKYFNLIYCGNNLTHSRLGVVVSRKIGKAVVRNKIKRWVREIFRRHKNLIPWPLDILVVATRGIEGVSWAEYREEYFHALSKIGRREKRN